MRYGIISDIHGNLQALEAVLEDINERNVDKVYCLGDVVGYGANPSECLDILRQRQIPCIMGNHDYVAAFDNGQGGGMLEKFNRHAKQAMKWTRDHLTEEETRFLKELPYTREENGLVLAHGSLVRPEDFEYIKIDFNSFSVSEDRRFIRENIDALREGQILVVGHTHQPFKIAQPEIAETIKFDELIDGYLIGGRVKGNAHLENSKKAILNPGSVGQPRDRNPNARYAVYDDEKKTVRWIEVRYDIEEAQERMRKEGLPEILIGRISEGW